MKPIIPLLGLLAAAPLHAALPVNYDADAANPDPTTQGWTAIETVVGSDSSPVDGLIDSGANVGPVSASPDPGFAWQIRDQISSPTTEDGPGYKVEPTLGEMETLFNDGFRMSYRIRAKQNHGTQFKGQPWCGGVVVYFPGSVFNIDMNHRLFMPIGIDTGDNAFQIFEEQDETTIRTLGANSADTFHTVTIVKPPLVSMFRWYVDGVFVAEVDLALGLTTGDQNQVSFISGTGPGINGTFDIRSLHLGGLGPWFVDADATGANNGSSWANAFTSLQDALAVAQSGDEIWVADGTYYPDEGLAQTDNARSSTFNLVDGVAIYGGFDGTETNLSERDPAANEAILSGDLLKNDGPDFANNSENAYHVLFADGVGAATILDGFTITAGNADASPDNSGGGLYCQNGASPTLTHCSFQGNSADFGGGIYNLFSSPTLTNCSFQGNTAQLAGAVYNLSASAFYINCSFQGNQADEGGVSFESTSNSSYINCSFQGNQSISSNGSIYTSLSQPNFKNCIIWNNSAGGATDTANASLASSSSPSPILSHCLVENWTAAALNASGGTNNLDGTNPANDPLFVSEVDPLTAPHTTGGDLRLTDGSPALNVGDNAANTEPLDLGGVDRIQFGTIDLGAYEGIEEQEIEVELAGVGILTSGYTIDLGLTLHAPSLSLPLSGLTVRNLSFANSLNPVGVSVTGPQADEVILVSFPPATIPPLGFGPIEGSVKNEVLGELSATLEIASNDADENPFEINLTWIVASDTNDADNDGLSDYAEYADGDPFTDPNDPDTDGDGINDGGEVALAALGFDNGTDDSALVSLLQTNSASMGLYTESSIQLLAITQPVISRDPVSGEFTLRTELFRSPDLAPASWATFPDYSTEKTPGTGELLLKFDPPDPNVQFFQIFVGE